MSEKPLVGEVLNETEFRLILVGHTVFNPDERTHLSARDERQKAPQAEERFFVGKDAANNSMDVRAKQRLCYRVVWLLFGGLGGGFAPRHLSRSLSP